MGSKWTYSTIADCASEEPFSTQIGPFGNKIKAEIYTPEGAPVLRGINVNTNSRFNDSDFVYIDQGYADSEFKKFTCKAGDVVLCHKGTLGKIGIIPKNSKYGTYIMGNSMMKVRTDEQKLKSSFLYYWLCSFEGQDYLFSRVSQVGVPQIQRPLSTLREAEIPIPPLREQKVIAHILGSLDDKIELNRKMNATLEAMAQALFKSWFVDFDPVIDNALAAGNPIPPALQAKAELRMLNAETNSKFKTHHSSFPSKFTWTETMGWIPEGWETGIITDLADLNSESWSNKTHPDHVNYVDLANTKNGRINEVFPYDYSEAPSRARRVLKVGDTIIGTVRPGNRSFAYIHEDGLTGSTGFAVLRPKKEACRTYVYLCLTQDDVIDYFAHLADGGAYPAIRPEVVGNFETITFPQELMERFDQKAYPLIEKIGQHQRETDTLTKLRDTLLPKLISGELRVSGLNNPQKYNHE
jgi:type I restriction enzyme S subunit